jgi:hypothetical protein
VHRYPGRKNARKLPQADRVWLEGMNLLRESGKLERPHSCIRADINCDAPSAEQVWYQPQFGLQVVIL